MVFHRAAGWNYWDTELTAFLRGEPSESFDARAASEGWPDIAALIESGELLWVVFYEQEDTNEAATPEHGRAWAEENAPEGVPVLVDPDPWEMLDYIDADLYPTLWVVAPDMTVTAYDPENPYLSLRELKGL
jgi:hypothetical protein